MSVTLRSNDGQEFHVSEDICTPSRYLENQLQNGRTEIVLEDIKADTLKLVINYLTYYSNNDIPKIPDVVTSNDLKKQVSAWDYKFINGLSFEQTFSLINAGLALELDHLHDLGCAKVACFMKGKTPDEINKEFTIECQLTQDEATQLGLDTK